MTLDRNNKREVNSSKDFIKCPWVILKLNAVDEWITHGPYTTKQVSALLKSEEVTPNDYCWRSGWTEWKPIYSETEFYLSRKPPIELGQKVKMIKEVLFDSKHRFSELAHKITPLQYKDWKYKKNQTDQIVNDGVLSMLEPWDSKTKNLDFHEEDKKLKDKSKDKLAIPFVSSPFENIANMEESDKKHRKITKYIIFLSIITMISLIIFSTAYRYFMTPELNFNMSYFVVEDYINELPEYMYARTDLKKNQTVKIRLFDAKNKQIRTRQAKAGLILSSKGTGRMRIPMYAYSLKEGSYKLKIEIEGQTIEKEFIISKSEETSAISNKKTVN